MTARQAFVVTAALAVAMTFAATRVARAQDLYIQNARVLDVEAREETRTGVLIEDGVLTGFPSSIPKGFDGTSIDAGGRWVLPALSDMHTHSVGDFTPPGGFHLMGAETVARVALYAGVARYLDLFADEDEIFAARAERRNASTPAADIFAAGPCMTAPDGHCSEYGVPTRIIDSPADAVREVNELAKKHPDVVKVVYDHMAFMGSTMPTIDKATLDAVVETARSHGLKTVVHVGTWQDLRESVEAGAEAVTHVPPGSVPDGVPELMLEHGTVHIPTLAVQGDYARFVDAPTLLDSPLLLAMVGETRALAYKKTPGAEFAGYVEYQRASHRANLEAVRALASAGVPMITGTDGGNPGIFQGYSVHRELRLLVEAGVSTWDALAGSTVHAGRLLGRKWGMSLGHEGTLLILDESPIEDIQNTEKIHAVVLRGELVDRAALLQQ